ncbi:DNA-directed RNA polymerase I subunit RPA1 [Chamberlinius hualienensis]
MGSISNMLSRIPTVNLSGIQFSAFSPDEIRKLSVLEINNFENFDNLGHPTVGGLYDPRLGPNERSQECQTCGLNASECPGHIGHINLPLIVFNPLFLRTSFQLIKITCLNCHRFRCNKMKCILLSAQLKALDHGLLNLVVDMEDLVTEINAADMDKEACLIKVQIELDSMLKTALEGLDLDKGKNESFVKNVVEIRLALVKRFIDGKSSGELKKCQHDGCNTPKRNLFLEFNARIVVGARSKRQLAQKKKVQPTKKKQTVFTDELGVQECEMAEDNDGAIDDGEEWLGDCSQQSYLTPQQAKEHLTKLYENEKTLVSQLYATTVRSIDSFFIEVLPVSPSKFRPVAHMGSRKFDNPQSAALSRLVQECYVIKHILFAINSEKHEFSDKVKGLVAKITGEELTEKLQTCWNSLQRRVNACFDSDMDRFNKSEFPGVKQVLEKKEGLFRMFMMGKRVNFACRSVISPDPYIDVGEIGVPLVFATKLTYPVIVNQYNKAELKQAVLNGPDVHPGAIKVQTEEGHTILLGRDKAQRQRIANKLFNGPREDSLSGIKMVHRHLKDGDVMLLNRQPTLHKPSIMAHKARVLKGQKTLRLNYSNCKSYNADFDGDEMNAHLPQTEVARSEAYMIANVENQYLVPKDGTPLGGLIQDHIIGAAKLMKRGEFFSNEDYCQLVYSTINKKKGKITLLPPAILKPRLLWSGKQIVSTVLINSIPEGQPLINLTGASKISDKCWQRSAPRKWKAGGTYYVGKEMSEHEVILRNGELLCGILDKSHCGPTQYGLIHCCHELYGGQVGTELLSRLERLFTNCVQLKGFSLGVEDIIVTYTADRKRREIMQNSQELGYKTVSAALKLAETVDEKTVKEKYMKSHLMLDDKGMKDIDNAMKSKTDDTTNAINKVCMPDGLLKKFPDNNLQLMVLSGAKGSMVNCMQISCLLGQIELEGRRPPLMISGKSLPSFQPYSTLARAGGFVDQRFLSGVKPQEYFFHCMAGREGLIDTAVKTSRSGYLQRCLIKHLEGLTVAYDMTVRDSDGSVIQFKYGEDGLDILKVPFLKPQQIPFLVDNHRSIANNEVISLLKENELFSDIIKHTKKARKYLKGKLRHKEDRNSGFLKFCENSEETSKENLVDQWFNLDPEERERYKKKVSKYCDPTLAVYNPEQHLGAISEKLDSIIESYVKNQKLKDLSSEDFRDMMHYKIQSSVCHPGEAVGLLAAQSIGEPSTQMTLNTFHFAGRGEMNVTLGIPRLREILMTASANIATPSLEIPLLGETSEIQTQHGEHLKKKLNEVRLSDVIHKYMVTERINFNSLFKDRTFLLRFEFLPHKVYKNRLNARPSIALRCMENFFFKSLIQRIKQVEKSAVQSSLFHDVIAKESVAKSKDADNDEEIADVNETKYDVEDDEAGDSSADEEAGDDEDARMTQMRQKDREYQLDEEEEQIKEENNPSDKEEDDEDGSNETKMNLTEVTEKEIEKEDDEKSFLAKLDTASARSRINKVLSINPMIFDYKYDAHKHQWCEITIKLNIGATQLNMADIIGDVLKSRTAQVYHVKGIKKAFVVDQTNSNGTCQRILKTEGINIRDMFNYENMVDLNRLYSNDIHAIAKNYGIEAAARVILKEIQNVFMVYGIEVDPRHLLLIADYMTFDGHYKPFSRLGLENSPSSLQQMSFESTVHFLKMATQSGFVDSLKSPSSRLVAGRPVSCGTGSFDLLAPIK